MWQNRSLVMQPLAKWERNSIFVITVYSDRKYALKITNYTVKHIAMLTQHQGGYQPPPQTDRGAPPSLVMGTPATRHTVRRHSITVAAVIPSLQWLRISRRRATTGALGWFICTTHAPRLIPSWHRRPLHNSQYGVLCAKFTVRYTYCDNIVFEAAACICRYLPRQLGFILH